jgi:hypothetical protein
VSLTFVLIPGASTKPGETAGEWGEGTDQEAGIPPLCERFGPPDEWGPEAVAHVFYHDVGSTCRCSPAPRG